MNLFKSLALVLVFGGVLSAESITWNLTNVTVGFGGVTAVTGSFLFDADTDTFSSLNITTSGDNSILPATSSWFFDVNADGSERNDNGTAGFSAVDTSGSDDTGAQFISLFSTGGGPLMTDAGGTINLTFFFIGTCLNSDCSFVNQQEGFSRNGSGEFTATGVATAPEPASLLLGSSALILFGVRRRLFR